MYVGMSLCMHNNSRCISGSPAKYYKKAGLLDITPICRNSMHPDLVPYTGTDTVMLVLLTFWPLRFPLDNASGVYLTPFTSQDGNILLLTWQGNTT